MVRNSPFKPDLAVTGVLYGLPVYSHVYAVLRLYGVPTENGSPVPRPSAVFGTLTSPPLGENPQPTPVEPRFPDGGWVAWWVGNWEVSVFFCGGVGRRCRPLYRGVVPLSPPVGKGVDMGCIGLVLVYGAWVLGRAEVFCLGWGVCARIYRIHVCI